MVAVLLAVSVPVMLNDTSPEYASLVASKVNVADVAFGAVLLAVAYTSVPLPIVREV